MEKINRTNSIILSIVLFLSFNLNAQQKDSIAVANATQKFVKAFTDFDWVTFKNCFANEATIFFPSKYGKRKNGRQEIEAVWKEFFPEFIDSSKKFDLKLNPQNALIQLLGSTAIVTFHLGEETDYLSRRTLVFIKEKEDWKIVHLHASGFKQEKQ